MTNAETPTGEFDLRGLVAEHVQNLINAYVTPGPETFDAAIDGVLELTESAPTIVGFTDPTPSLRQVVYQSVFNTIDEGLPPQEHQPLRLRFTQAVQDALRVRGRLETRTLGSALDRGVGQDRVETFSEMMQEALENSFPGEIQQRQAEVERRRFVADNSNLTTNFLREESGLAGLSPNALKQIDEQGLPEVAVKLFGVAARLKAVIAKTDTPAKNMFVGRTKNDDANILLLENHRIDNPDYDPDFAYKDITRLLVYDDGRCVLSRVVMKNVAGKWERVRINKFELSRDGEPASDFGGYSIIVEGELTQASYKEYHREFSLILIRHATGLIHSELCRRIEDYADSHGLNDAYTDLAET